MTSYATTTYRPAEGGHRYATDGPDGSPCGECGGHRWEDQHRLVEEYVPELGPERPRFAVEVSTTRGRDWATNGLRWPNAEDARLWGSDLGMRWIAPTDIVVVECDNDGNPTDTVVAVVFGDAPFSL